MGSEIMLLRQRYFIDHTYDSQTFITVEYTVIANNTGINNIFIEVPHFLLNLKIYDMDNEQLALLPNESTYALIEDRIDRLNYQIRKHEQQELMKYYDEIRNHKKYLLWIKLPPSKKLVKGQLRILTLKYDTEIKSKSTGKLELDFPINQTHVIFYAMRKPKDYEFTNARIEITQGNEKPKKYKGEDNTDDLIYVNKGFDSMVITKKSETTMPIKVRYSFQPDKNITKGPLTLAGWLYILPLMVIVSKILSGLWNESPPPGVDSLIQHKLELGLGIITASLVLPTLVNNQLIRNSLRIAIYVPVLLSIIMIFMP